MSVRLTVTYADHQHGYFDVPEGEGWRIDAATRCIVIGRGVPRKMVPLDGVQVIEVTIVEDPPDSPERHDHSHYRTMCRPACPGWAASGDLRVDGGSLDVPWVLDDPEQAEDPEPPLTFVRDVRVNDLVVRRGQTYTCFTRAGRESLLAHGYAEECG